jgi:hypothetical protein
LKALGPEREDMAFVIGFIPTNGLPELTVARRGLKRPVLFFPH